MYTGKKMARPALLIAAFLSLVTIICLIAIFLPEPPQEADIADIYQNGELILSIPLDPSTDLISLAVSASAAEPGPITDLTPLTDQQGQEQQPSGWSFTVEGDNHCFNRIEIRGNSIGITEADCPDKLCVHQGFIHSLGLPITCLPNRLVIQLRKADPQTPGGFSSSQEIDAVSY